jgi:hypothetical protein
MTVSPGSNDQLDENSAIGYRLPNAHRDPLRMEQSGSRSDQKQAYGGAKAGRRKFLQSWSRSWRG